MKGDTVDVFLAYADYAYRVTFFGDEIEELESIDPVNGKRIDTVEHIAIFPAYGNYFTHFCPKRFLHIQSFV